MRNPSIRRCCTFVIAAAVALASATVAARTLTLTAATLHDPHAGATDLRVVFDERAVAGALHVSAARIDVPQLALGGRIDWACELKREGGTGWACAGPVQFVADGEAAQSADLAARIAGHRIELTLTRDGARIVVTLPIGADDATGVALQQVPAAWLRAPLAQAWKGGEVRSGVFDIDAKLNVDGRIEARYKAADLTFNTLDGTVSGTSLAVTGELDWSPAGADVHLVASATSNGGRVGIGGVHVVLPETPVAMNLDAMMRADGLWGISRFAWNDPDALQFEANGSFEPAELAPLRALNVHIARAQFPLAKERYAQTVLAAQGLDALTLRGELSGDLVVDARGLRRVSLATPRLDIRDGAGPIALTGINGGIDWAAAGTQPATTLTWKSADIEGVTLPASSSHWQSRDGALNLLGSLRTKLFGGELRLQETLFVRWRQRRTGSVAHSRSVVSAMTARTVRSPPRHLAAEGRLRVSGGVGQPHVQHRGEPQRWRGAGRPGLREAASHAGRDRCWTPRSWARAGSCRNSHWNDSGVLDLGANGEIAVGRRAASASAATRPARRAARPRARALCAQLACRQGFRRTRAAGALSGSLALRRRRHRSALRSTRTA